MVIYLASPMASTKRKDEYSYSEDKFTRNKKIADKLRESGYDIYLPQENPKGTENPKDALGEELDIIRNSEFLIILLSDTRGIYLEAGYAKALGKKVYAIEVLETRKYSEWLAGFFDYIAKDVYELIDFLKKQ